MKNLIIYISISLGTLYILFMYRQPSLLFVFIAQIVFLLLLFFIRLHLKKSLSATVDIDSSPAHKERQIPIHLHFKNCSLLPAAYYCFEIRYKYPFSKKKGRIKYKGSIAPNQTTAADCMITSACCGILPIEISDIRCYDPLKIFYFKLNTKKELSVTVLPNIHETSVIPSQTTRLFFSDSDSYAEDKSGDDPSEVFRIREYRAGDKAANIHWKLTAKKGEPMVRENSLPLGYHVLILLDCGRFPPEIPKDIACDAYTEAVLSVSNSLKEYDCRHYVAWYDSKAEQLRRHPVDDEASFYSLMNEILRTTLGTSPEHIYELYQQTFMYSRQNTVIRIDESLNIYLNDRFSAALDMKHVDQSLRNLRITA